MSDDAFSRACGTVIPFGKYRGKTLARIGSSDEGLRYLDWLRGEGIQMPDIRDAVAVYLDHPAIARQLDTAIEDRD